MNGVRKKRKTERGAKDRAKAKAREGRKVSISNPNSSEDDDRDDESEKEEEEELEDEEEEELERSWAFSAAQEGALSDSDRDSPEEDGIDENINEREIVRNVPFLTSTSTSISPKKSTVGRKVTSVRAPVRMKSKSKKQPSFQTGSSRSSSESHEDQEASMEEILRVERTTVTKQKSVGIYIELSD